MVAVFVAAGLALRYKQAASSRFAGAKTPGGYGMKTFTTATLLLLTCCAVGPGLADAKDTPPTVQTWVEGKLRTVASGCIGEGNLRSLLKKGSIIPPSLNDWETFKSNLASPASMVRAGSAGRYMGQVMNSSSGQSVVLGSLLSGTYYPPRAVSTDGMAVTHTQNCVTMLAGKGNLKLSAVILQAALDATYSGNDIQALVLEGGTMTSAYAWALDDASGAQFPGLERSEVMLDIWAWYRRNPVYAANDKLSIYGSMSAVEAHLVKETNVETLLKGSASAGGAVPFFNASVEGNGSAKVMTNSKADGFETAVFRADPTPLLTASALAERLESRLHLVMDENNQVWFNGDPIKLAARLAPVPQSACENTWAVRGGVLDNTEWDEKTRTCRFDMTFTSVATATDPVTVTVALVSTVGTTGGPSIEISKSVILSNEAAKISFSSVAHSVGALPPIGSAAAVPLTLTYRISQNRTLDDVSANYQLSFKCGTDADIQIPIKDAHRAVGNGTTDVMVSIDVPASALANIAQTPVRCTVGGKITIKSTGKGGALVQDKTLPTYNFDLVRPAAPTPSTPPAQLSGTAEAHR
jgi:hypothetical protein